MVVVFYYLRHHTHPSHLSKKGDGHIQPDMDHCFVRFQLCLVVCQMTPQIVFFSILLSTQQQMNIVGTRFRAGLGCTLLLYRKHQMRVPTDGDYSKQMKRSFKLSPGFAQKTTRDIMNANMLFPFVL